MTRLIPDPLERPHLHKTPDDGPVGRVLRAFGVEQPVLLANPVTQPPDVQGVTVGPSCARCGVHVWLSPSSARHRAMWKSAVCLPCVLRALLPGEREQVEAEWRAVARRAFGLTT